ncbi:MAG: VacJ family lipoprotein [Pseudomonadota bacterium]
MTGPRTTKRPAQNEPPSPKRPALPIRLALVLPLALGACADTGGPGASFAERDPYESTNRAIHDVNVALDSGVLRPASQAYDFVMPTLLRHFIVNVINHLDTVNDFINYTLQGEIDPALTALGRFSVNTVVGAGGLLDPATEFGLPKENTDLGITLGKYGVDAGAYLVLPLFGPSTVRDAVGRLGDLALSPLTYINPLVDSTALTVFSPALQATDVIEQRAANFDLIDQLLYDSDDSYVSLRTVYLQRRDALLRGEDDDGALPNIFDDDITE